MAKMSKKQIEKKYNCNIHMEWVDGFRFYTAFSNEPKIGFSSASGWGLDELLESIEENNK